MARPYHMAEESERMAVADKNERLAAEQARGLHSPVGPRPGAPAQVREDDARAIREYYRDKELRKARRGGRR